MSLYIQKNSLVNDNNIQKGKLMFQYADTDARQCVLQSADDKITFHKEIMTFYIIIKDTDNIRILTMTQSDNTINQILKFTVNNTDVTFSNKECVINRLKNWNANIYTFGIYNVPLKDDDISYLYNHITNEYMKYIDINFIDMIKKYNEILSMLENFKKCPYNDEQVCNKCSAISDWTQLSQIVGSTKECRTSINTFCLANKEHVLCKCWNNKNNSTYNSNSCKMFRNIFNENTSFLDDLTQDDIDFIMSKYGLIKPEDCPKAIKKPSFLKNKYSEYDFNKIRINMDEDEAQYVKSVATVYPDSAKKEDDEYDWQKLKVKYDDTVQNSVSKDLDIKNLKVNNLYKKDTSMNYKFEGTDAAKEYEKIKQQSSAQADKLQDTSDLNIIPEKSWDNEEENKAIGSKTSSFFDRFMKITLPNK
jgi:hypothetical protein